MPLPTLPRLAALLAASAAGVVAPLPPDPDLPFFPGVHDAGIILPFGDGHCPGNCDALGARDTWVWHDSTDSEWPFKMTYDGSGPSGWLACLAVSDDPTLRRWTKLGTQLQLGKPGAVDSKSASYLTTLFDAESSSWVGYYLGTNQSSPPPGDVPIGPYYTLLATAPTSSGPWTQFSARGNVIPSGSPGVVIPNPDDPSEYWQFCTGCAGGSIGLATTRNLTGYWEAKMPLVTSAAVENTSLYQEPTTGMFFLFTNHIGPDEAGVAFDDAIWVYWSMNLTSWPADQVAVVLNRTNVVEPSFKTGRVGLPSVLKVPGNDKQLALVYDGGGTRDNVAYNENNSVALAWLDLPLQPPARRCGARRCGGEIQRPQQDGE